MCLATAVAASISTAAVVAMSEPPRRPFSFPADCASTRTGVCWVGELTFGPPLPDTDAVLDVVVDGAVGCVGVGNRLVLFDASDLSAPQEIATIEPGIGGGIDLLLEGSLLYVSTLKWMGEYWMGALLVLDVSNPRFPQVIGEVTHTRFGSAVILGKSGNRIYLERPSDFFPTLFVVDVTDPSTPVVVHVDEQPPANRWLSLAPFAGPRGPCAYVLVRNEGVRIADLSLDAPTVSEPLLAGNWDRLALAPSGTWAALVGPNAETKLRFTMLDLREPLAPFVCDELDPAFPAPAPTFWSTVRELAVVEDFVVAAWDRGIFLAQPHGVSQTGSNGSLSPSLVDVGYLRSHALATDLCVTEDHLLVGEHFRGLQFYERREDRSERLLATFKDPVPNSLEILEAVEIVKDHLFVARFVESFADPYSGNFRETQIIDLSFPQEPVTAHRITAGPGLEWAGATEYKFARGTLWAWRSKFLEAIDVADPLQPARVSSTRLVSAGAPSVRARLTLEGSRLVVATDDGVAGRLFLLDGEDAQMPVLLGETALPSRGRAVAAHEGIAYVACGPAGVAVVDIETAPPIVLRTLDLGDPLANACDVEVALGILLVAAEEGDLLLFDLSSPREPVFSARVALPRAAYDLAVQGNLLYVANQEAGVSAVDLTDPQRPLLIGTVACSIDPQRVLFSERYGVALDQTSGVDLLRPNCASLLQSVPVEDAVARNTPRPATLAVSPIPARGRVLIRWVGESGPAGAHIDIVDVAGRVVRHFDAAETRAGNAAAVSWDGRDDTGRAVASGVYFGRARGADGAGGGVAARFVYLR